MIDLKLFLKTSNEGILSRGTWVTFAALRQSSIWPTTSPHLLFYVLLLSLQEKKHKNKKQNFNFRTIYFFFDSVVTNARLSHSFYLLQNWIIVTKLMESIDYFPSGQMYQNMEHLN